MIAEMADDFKANRNESDQFRKAVDMSCKDGRRAMTITVGTRQTLPGHMATDRPEMSPAVSHPAVSSSWSAAASPPGLTGDECHEVCTDVALKLRTIADAFNESVISSAHRDIGRRLRAAGDELYAERRAATPRDIASAAALGLVAFAALILPVF